MTRVKICGITNLSDALCAADLGAHALGFVFAPSPRQISADEAAAIIRRLPPFLATVALFVDEKPDHIRESMQITGCRYLQLHGSEPPELVAELTGFPVIKAFRLRHSQDLEELARYPDAAAFLLDSYLEGVAGGTGQSFDWSLAVQARRFSKPIILAGGLNPENVAQAIRAARPDAVDVSSGVEAAPGKKDPEKMKRFLEAIRGL